MKKFSSVLIAIVSTMLVIILATVAAIVIKLYCMRTCNIDTSAVDTSAVDTSAVDTSAVEQPVVEKVYHYSVEPSFANRLRQPSSPRLRRSRGSVGQEASEYKPPMKSLDEAVVNTSGVDNVLM